MRTSSPMPAVGKIAPAPAAVMFALLFAALAAGCSDGGAVSDAARPAVNTAVIELTGDSRYKSVRLTPAIYNAANADLSDLRIRDADGGYIPYFIHSGTDVPTENVESFPMEPVDAYLKDDSFFFDYKLAAVLDGDALATSLEFSTRQNAFAKAVELYGSHDGVHWDYILADTLYSVDGTQKLSIAFERPLKYTYYRLKLANNLERLAFDAVDLVYAVTRTDESRFVESLTPAYSVEQGGRETRVVLSGVRHLRLCDITVNADGMFRRTVNSDQDGALGDIYNLALNGVSYADMTLPLDRIIPRDEHYVLTIENGDDRPIDIKVVTLRYYADELVFEGAAGADSSAYTLEFGASPNVAAPVYDIALYQSEILSGPIDRLALGAITLAPVADTPPERDYRTVFNIVMICVALLLGAVTLAKLRGRKPGNRPP